MFAEKRPHAVSIVFRKAELVAPLLESRFD
jgi:hypothetical protein